MATAAKKDQMVECGFCGRKNEALEEPKLPCKHVHCFGCLSAYSKAHRIIRCPVKGCGEVVEISLTNLPSHDTSDACASLSTRDRNRDIGLDIRPVEEVQIDSVPRQTTPIAPLISLTLLNTVKFPNHVTSVFGYEGNTYVGSYDNSRGWPNGGAVTRVDAGFGRFHLFDFDKPVGGLFVHRDRLYSIKYGNSCFLYEHDLLGEQKVMWSPQSSTDYFLGLVVCSDQLVVPDKTTQQLVVYDPFLEVKRISCAQKLSIYWIFLCAAGDNNVVVSDYDTSQVFKVNIDTDEIKWTCGDITNPRGVTCYRDQYVLVVSSKKLHILDIHTGIVVSTQRIPGSCKAAFDIHTSGNTLALTDFTGKCVHFFQLNP